MLKILPREPLPEWLKTYQPGDQISFQNVVKGSIYYPACGFDGDVANICMGYSHSFIYVDNLCLWTDVTKESVYAEINSPNSFVGFRKIYQQEYSYEELLGPFHVSHEKPVRIDGDPEGRFEPQPFFAILTIFEPVNGISKEYVRSDTSTFHGIYERLAFLYICDDGCKAYERLYQSHNASPKAIAIIQPGNAFGGNWTNYYDEKQIFARIVSKNPGGQPEIMIFGGLDSRGGWYRRQHWSNYPNRIYYSRLYNKGISLWSNQKVGI